MPQALKRARWAATARAGLVVAAVAGITVALSAAVSDAGEVPWPTRSGIAIAAGCIAATLLLSAVGWVTLLDGAGRRVLLVRGFLVAQLGKYVPGGVVQVAGQYDMARRTGIEARRVAVALPVHAMSATVSAGGAAAVVLSLVGTDMAWPVRVLFGAAGVIGSTLATSRRLLGMILDLAHRRWTRVPDASCVPSQGAILRAAALGVVGSVCYGAAYAVMVTSAGSHVAVAAGFVVAFTVGFLALPFPSGLGIREVALVALLDPYAPVATLLAAAVGLRIVQLVVELVLVGLVSLLARGATRRSRHRAIAEGV